MPIRVLAPMRAFFPRRLGWLGTGIVCCTMACIASAQQDERAKIHLMIGCWTLEPGPFSVVGKTGVDPGQTASPSRIRLDTLPGTSWSGEPLGRLVRVVDRGNNTRYRDGYYLFSGTNGL